MKAQTKQPVIEADNQRLADRASDADSIALDPVPQTSANLRDMQPSSAPRLVTVKALAIKYGIKPVAIYEFIKTEPDFPYVNVGVKKKFLVDVDQFEAWLSERTKKQKHEHFAIPSVVDLMTSFKSKKVWRY